MLWEITKILLFFQFVSFECLTWILCFLGSYQPCGNQSDHLVSDQKTGFLMRCGNITQRRTKKFVKKWFKDISLNIFLLVFKSIFVIYDFFPKTAVITSHASAIFLFVYNILYFRRVSNFQPSMLFNLTCDWEKSEYFVVICSSLLIIWSGFHYLPCHMGPCCKPRLTKLSNYYF